jgi:hypothetical protein
MTLNQLNSLDELELAMALVVVNVIDPMTCPKIEFLPRDLTWFRHEFLIKKLVNAFPKLLPDGYTTYVSLLSKLGYVFEIPKQPTEIPTPTSEMVAPLVETPQTGSMENTSSL